MSDNRKPEIQAAPAERETMVERVRSVLAAYAPTFREVAMLGQHFRNDLSKAGVLTAPVKVLSGVAPSVVLEDVIEAILAPIDQLEAACREVEKRFYVAGSLASELAQIEEAHHA